MTNSNLISHLLHLYFLRCDIIICPEASHQPDATHLTLITFSTLQITLTSPSSLKLMLSSSAARCTRLFFQRGSLKNNSMLQICVEKLPFLLT